MRADSSTCAGVRSLLYRVVMCRSIVTLRRPDEPPTDDEVRAAALQFVRKISGYRKPSKRNEEAFEAAVEDIAVVSKRLLEAVTVARAEQI
jgi:hypothetical protein